MRVIFLGTPDFAVPSLKAIYEAKMSISLVVTQPDRKKGRGKQMQPPPLKKLATELDLPIIQPVTIKDKDVWDKLAKIKPDVIVVVAYGQIIPEEILHLPRFGCINVHASLLPKYRGAAPIHWTIINGEKETGITIMQMDKGLDTGDIIMQEKIPIALYDTLGSIHDRLAELGSKMIVTCLESLEYGIGKLPQNHEIASNSPKINKALERINWQDSALRIHNLIRGLNPTPGAHSLFKDDRIKIWASKLVDLPVKSGVCGEIVEFTPDGIIVKTGDGFIMLTEMQLPGRKRLPTQELLKGYPIKKGEKLK